MKVNIIKFLNNFNSYLFELKKSKKIKIFTLIKTSGIYDPYLSPVRESKKIITIGIVSNNIDILNYISVEDLLLFNFFFIDHKFKEKNTKKIDIDVYFKKYNYYFFHPNEITIDAAIQYLTLNKFKFLKEILIVGSGNIGTKLAFNLFELGFNVTFSRRNHKLGNLTEKLIKNMYGKKKNSIRYSKNFQKEIINSDCIIACSNSKNIINLNDYKNIKKLSVLMELGKNNFSKSLISKITKNISNIYRVNINNTLLNFLESSINYINIEKKKFGRRVYKDIYLVSGGYLGRNGDIVVDDINNPKKIYGVSNGSGDFKKNINLDKYRNILLD